MTVKILMPALSPTMKEGSINKWLVKIGDKVKPGDIIAEIETDKATMELEAVDEGIITHLIDTKINKNITVNSVIALINGSKSDQINNLQENNINLANNTITKKNDIKIETNLNDIKLSEKKIDLNKVIISSPFTKQYAIKNNLDLKKIKGTGPDGRIIKRDVINLNNRDEAISILRKYEIINPSNIRKVIAEKTYKTKNTVPHFYLTVESDAENLILLRKAINKNNENNVSYNDIIVKALALAMKKNPDVNISWIDGKIYKYSSIDISIAVALKEGLITPIVKDADKKGIKEISNEIKDLIIKAKENKLSIEEYTGGSISISNLGMYGIAEFSAILNPPQSLILALGKINKVAVVKNNQVKVGHTIKSTISVDHRALDGATAAKFLKNFNEIIEDPFKIWLESNDLEII